MKKRTAIFSIMLTALLCSCTEKLEPAKITLDVESEKESYGERIIISPLDESVQILKSKIILAPKVEGVTYTISGYFDGQIISSTKNTTIKLNNAYLENRAGKPALRAAAKTEISTTKDSVNYIVTRGNSLAKKAALEGKRDLVLGGSGTVYIKNTVCHGIEADDVKIKGSGVLYVQGTRRGSALTCETLTVESEKSFTAYFLNSKNGIKAENKIAIDSGNFHLYNNGTALKTERADESSERTRSIALNGGTFYTYKNTTLYATDSFTNDGAVLIEEDKE